MEIKEWNKHENKRKPPSNTSPSKNHFKTEIRLDSWLDFTSYSLRISNTVDFTFGRMLFFIVLHISFFLFWIKIGYNLPIYVLSRTVHILTQLVRFFSGFALFIPFRARGARARWTRWAETVRPRSISVKSNYGSDSSFCFTKMSITNCHKQNASENCKYFHLDWTFELLNLNIILVGFGRVYIPFNRIVVVTFICLDDSHAELKILSDINIYIVNHQLIWII